MKHKFTLLLIVLMAISSITFADECTTESYLKTGDSGLGKMTTDDSEVWTYNPQYGAVGKKQGGATGHLFTPVMDLSFISITSITLSFQHVHKFAVTPSTELTAWVTSDFKGSWSASEWHQLSISPYASNTDWTFVDVSINVPLSYVGSNTVFAFQYESTSSNYATWEIKKLEISACVPEDLIGVQIDELYYNLNPTTLVAEVTSPPYSGENWNITTANIPATVRHNDMTYLVTSINGAFNSCQNLTSVTIPNSVTKIGDASFAYCSKLPSIGIPQSVTEIGYVAFLACSSLSSITIPKSVKHIGQYPFLLCGGLNSIFVENDNKYYDSRDNCNAIIETSTNTLITACKNTSIPKSIVCIGEQAFAGIEDLTSLIIHNGVTTIGYGAFSGCTHLNSIVLSKTIENIGSQAFSGCNSLLSITCEATMPPSLGDEVFNGVAKAIPLYVPISSIDLYKSAAQWNDFINIQAIPESAIIENLIKDCKNTVKQMSFIDGQLFILRDGKTYTIHGQEMK